MLSVAVSGFRVSRLATILHYTETLWWRYCAKKVDFTWLPWLARSDEKWRSTLGRGLGSGTVHIAGVVKHWFVRLARLVSHNRRPKGLLGVPF